MQVRLRSALTEWADDGPLVARLQELDREAHVLKMGHDVETALSAAVT
jgi:hypothetical protein